MSIPTNVLSEINALTSDIVQLSGVLVGLSHTPPADRALDISNVTKLNAVIGDLLDYYSTLIPSTL